MSLNISMRILFISTFYPPHTVGGWEQLVEEINQHLQTRGHETHILTSTHGGGNIVEEKGVDRVLSLEADLFHYRPLSLFTYPSRLRRNIRETQRVIRRFMPDIIFIHIMWNLSRGIAWTAEQMCPGRVVYYVADYWPFEPDVHTQYWLDPATKTLPRILKRQLAPFFLGMIERQNKRFHLAFERVICVSQAVKSALANHAKIPVDSMEVIYNGVDTNRFRPYSTDISKNKPSLDLVYAGSLVPHKGVHTAIQALAILHRQRMSQGITLTLIGSGHPDYEKKLRALVAEAGLESQVRFLGRVPREQMPDLLPRFDALIFPSIWEEPLARIVQEAMASGLVVLGTPTGGTPEILADGETGFIFPPEDPDALAGQILYLKNNQALLTTMRRNARQLVMNRFNIDRMIDEIEAYFLRLDITKRITFEPNS